MTTLVLARKYRPARFEQLVGQAHVVQALANALTRKRLHHAYLFTGTRGVGKTTVSRILAKSLNCTGPDGQGDITAEPCGQCAACRDIDSGRFVDYVELDAASNRGVDEITQLLDQAVYKPVVGRFKVYMIDEVHMLSATAFNAMLKTLEEPPDYLKFVLATTDPQKVPVTVLSRCLQFNLRPMAPEVIQEHLALVLGAEQVEAEPAALHLLARAAHGSMRDALSLTDQAIAFGGGALREAAVREMLGTADRAQVFALVQALAQGDGGAVVQGVDDLRAQGQAAAGVLEDMAWVLQQMAVLQLAPQAARASGLPEAEQHTLAELAHALPPDETQLLYSLCLRGRQELALAPDEYSGLTMTLLRLLAFKPAGEDTVQGASTPGPAGGRTAPARADLRPGPAGPVRHAAATRPAEPAPRPDTPRQVVHQVARGSPPVTPAARAAVDADDAPSLPAPSSPPPPMARDAALADRWDTLVQDLCAREVVNALARELALQAACESVQPGPDGDVWQLVCPRETLAQASVVSRLELALAQTLAVAVRLQVRVGEAADTPAQRAAQRQADRQRAADEIIQNDPFVVALMQQFQSARIVPGSVRPV